MQSLTREQVHRVDRLAIERLGISSLVLMENAGRGVADTIETFLRERDEAVQGPARLTDESAEAMVHCVLHKIAIVAGSGNNGGDGFVIARHLAMRGAHVTTFLIAPSARMAGDAATNLAILRKLGHEIREFSAAELYTLGASLLEFELVVDAVGGTGITGELRGEIATAVEQINASGRPVVAVDIPTGLDCDRGVPLGKAIEADLTVTFVARKKGFDVSGAGKYTGKVIVTDIGVPAEVAQIAETAAKT